MAPDARPRPRRRTQGRDVRDRRRRAVRGAVRRRARDARSAQMCGSTAALGQAREHRGARVPVHRPARDDGRNPGPKTQPIPFAQELERYAADSRRQPASPPTRRSRRTNSTRARKATAQRRRSQAAFAGFPQAALSAGGRRRTGVQRDGRLPDRLLRVRTAEATGGTVRVIVLDDSSAMWTQGQLDVARGPARRRQGAARTGDRRRQRRPERADRSNGDRPRAAVAQALAGGGASAYFYDAPEENVQRPLRRYARCPRSARARSAM